MDEAGASPSDPSDGSPRRRRPWLRVLIGLIAAVVAVVVLLVAGGGLRDAAVVVRRMDLGWVGVAFAAVVFRLWCYARQLARLARPSGRLSVLVAAGLSLSLFGLGAVTPAAPAEGLAIAGAELRRRGRPAPTAVLILGLSEWFAQRTFYAVAALNLFVVVVAGHVDADQFWPFLLVASAVVLVLMATAYAARRPATAGRAAVILGALRIRRPRLTRHARREAGLKWHAAAMAVVGSPINRASLALLSAAAVLADAATLWACCEAAGVHPHPDLVVLAATVGTVATWIPLLPAGLGLVEAAIPSILHHFGAPFNRALAATVVYRAAGTAVPAIVGLFAVAALHRADIAAATPN